MTTLRTPPESKLGIDLQAYRTDHPDEWRMDEFTREAEAMNEQNKALKVALVDLLQGGKHEYLTKIAIVRNARKALEQTK